MRIIPFSYLKRNVVSDIPINWTLSWNRPNSDTLEFSTRYIPFTIPGIYYIVPSSYPNPLRISISGATGTTTGLTNILTTNQIGNFSTTTKILNTYVKPEGGITGETTSYCTWEWNINGNYIDTITNTEIHTIPVRPPNTVAQVESSFSQTLVNALNNLQDEDVITLNIYFDNVNAPSPTPTPSITPTNTVTPTITPTPSITPTTTLTPTPTPTVTPTQINYSGYATTYIDAVTGVTGASLSNTEITAIYDLFNDLGTNGLYEKMKAFYPFMGGVAGSTKFNAKNPVDTDAAFRLTFNGGWTHSSSGITANGTNAYANTYLTSTVDLVDFSKHFAFYNSQASPNSSGWDGIWDSAGTGGVFGCNLNTGNQLGLGLNFLAGSLGTLPDYTTTFIGNVTGTTNNKFYENGNLFYTRTSTVSAFSNSLDYYIGCLNVNGSPDYYSNNIYGFYCLGSNLTSTEVSNLNTIINSFITAIGR